MADHSAAIAALKEFLDGEDNSEYFCFQEDFEEPPSDADCLMLSVNGMLNYTLSLPGLKMASDDPRLKSFLEQVNGAGKGEILEVMAKATEVSASLGLGDMEEDDEEDDAEIFDVKTEEEGEKKSNEDYEREYEFEKFVEKYQKKGQATVNKQASSRIIADLKLLFGKSDEFGFSATPRPDNLFIWDVKFFNIEKDTELFKDMGTYKKNTGLDHLLFECSFTPEYPFAPPFIRAVTPRFQFHTGHVTVGGSVCMELLTKKGWTAANSIESVLIAIRTEITQGGGRIDFNNSTPYTEQEARAAFIRVARDHKWEE